MGAGFEQEPTRPCLQRAKYQFVEVERGEHKDLGGDSGSATSARVAAIPSTFGMRMSSTTTSGLVRRTNATASAPSHASPVTSMSGSAFNSAEKPDRTNASSSTPATRITMGAQMMLGVRYRPA